MSKGQAVYWNTMPPEYTDAIRSKISKSVRALWNNPRFRAKQLRLRSKGYHWSLEARDNVARKARQEKLRLRQDRIDDLLKWFGGVPSERDWALMHKFGITSADYDEMFWRQGGVCAICHNPPINRRLCIDHDHVTGCVRGLLCDRCNRKVVGFIETIVGQEALRYLAKYNSLWIGPMGYSALGSSRCLAAS
jgi:hypothetical protein